MKEASEVKVFKAKFDPEKYDEFLKVISQIYSVLSHKAKDSISLSNIIKGEGSLKSNLKENYISKPEEFTRENVINLLLDFLGYGIMNRAGESELQRAFGRRHPDYTLIVNPNLHVLTEAEPLNEDLYSPGKGLDQVYEWLDSKRSRTDYGIATTGFEWILVQYLVEANKKVEIKKIDLRPFFLKMLGEKVDEAKLKKAFTEFYAYFSRETTDAAISGFIKVQSEKREQISKKFYERYLKMVFGVDKKGKKIYEHSLLDAIKGVDDEEDRKKLAQIIINRLIFVKFIESKGWINNNPRFLTEIKNGFVQNPSPGGFYRTYLEPLFFKALNEHGRNKPHPYENVRYLNGGLFRKGTTESKYPGYDIANDELLKVIDFLEEYSFEIKGAEKIEDGVHALDPEILGYIFERTANHEAGAYYTPENITTYIADQTIESLILERVNAYLKEKGKSEQEDIYKIFGDGGLDIDDLRNLYEKRKILDVKVLDPACGSGAFFIPAIRKLLDLNKKFYKEINRKEPDTYQLQKKIVENDIYGVDINSEAVEIAKLRLWLDLLDAVDDINKVDSLPNIEYNVMAGNSLIGAIEIPEDSRAAFYTYYHPMKFEQMLSMYPDFVEDCKKLTKSGEQFEATLHDILLLRNKLVAKYREETHPVYAARLRDVIQEMSKVFRDEISKVYLHKILGISSALELEEMKKKLKPFHWGMEFSDVFERGGFDVVIGNPPYVSAVEHSKDCALERETYKKEFPELKGAFDLYVVFLLQGLKLIQPGGAFSWIIPNKFLISDYAVASLAKLKALGLHTTVDVSRFEVFKDVGVYPIIIVGGKTNQEYGNYYVEDLTDLEKNHLKKQKEQFKFKTFKDFGIKIASGTTGFQASQIKPLIQDKESSPSGSIPFAVSGSIDPYLIDTRQVRYMGGKYSHPYITFDPQVLAESKWNFWTHEKIVVAGMTKRIEATYCKDPLALGVGCYAIYEYGGLDPRFLLGLLNSKFLTYYLNEKFRDKHLAGGYLAINKSTIEKLPLVESKPQEQKEVIQVVDKILEITEGKNSLSEKDKKEKIRELQDRIDPLVYRIYGLNEKEVAMVEKFFK